MISQAFVEYGIGFDYKIDTPVLRKILDSLDSSSRQLVEEEWGSIDSLSEYEFYQAAEQAINLSFEQHGVEFSSDHPCGPSEEEGLVYTIGWSMGYAVDSTPGVLETPDLSTLVSKKDFDEFFGQFFPADRIGLLVYIMSSKRIMNTYKNAELSNGVEDSSKEWGVKVFDYNDNVREQWYSTDPREEIIGGEIQLEGEVYFGNVLYIGKRANGKISWEKWTGK